MAYGVRPAGAAGVTLLELLIVLMLMAIIASVVIPIFGPGVSTTELKRSAREVAAGLRLARSQAIAQRSEAVLELVHRRLEPIGVLADVLRIDRVDQARCDRIALRQNRRRSRCKGDGQKGG